MGSAVPSRRCPAFPGLGGQAVGPRNSKGGAKPGGAGFASRQGQEAREHQHPTVSEPRRQHERVSCKRGAPSSPARATTAAARGRPAPQLLTTLPKPSSPHPERESPPACHSVPLLFSPLSKG